MRSTLLRLDQLEEREVPAVAMFTDFHGIWGSYPLNLTVSGNTLYFSADDGHGYQLYATDGSPNSAHEVAQIGSALRANARKSPEARKSRRFAKDLRILAR